MNKNILRQFFVITSFIFTLTVNALANILPINGQGTGEISDSFDVYFVPAGYVFSIWGLIYILLGIYTVYSALPSQRENPVLQKTGWLFVISNIFNGVWIFMWHYNLFGWSLVLMTGLLITLLAIYLTLDIGKSPAKGAEKWLVNLPFQVYLGWITVATIANTTNVLDWVGWSGWGISEETWMVIMLVVVLVVAGLMAFTRRDVPYLLVLVWALVGIALKHAAVAVVASTTWVVTVLVAGLVLFSLWKSRTAQA